MKRFIRNILTKYIFRFLYWDDINFRDIKDGDILVYYLNNSPVIYDEDGIGTYDLENYKEIILDLFMYDDINGNINWLKSYYETNGFWNYIEQKENCVYSISDDCWYDTNSQGYRNGYYKNGDFRKATIEETKLYHDKSVNRVIINKKKK